MTDLSQLTYFKHINYMSILNTILNNPGVCPYDHRRQSTRYQPDQVRPAACWYGNPVGCTRVLCLGSRVVMMAYHYGFFITQIWMSFNIHFTLYLRICGLVLTFSIGKLDINQLRIPSLEKSQSWIRILVIFMTTIPLSYHLPACLLELCHFIIIASGLGNYLFGISKILVGLMVNIDAKYNPLVSQLYQ